MEKCYSKMKFCLCFLKSRYFSFRIIWGSLSLTTKDSETYMFFLLSVKPDVKT